ncbi:CC0125/CC1285 family lipoprotein [Hirschia litorea]|uniref:Lipoprotein n=1 Tax=Hirschia litorea TaxID=1199156 RepID=A0ABW2IHI6_9PROT
MLRKLALSLACASFLTACATPVTTYTPANKDGVGFADMKIESNRFNVVFTGDTDASQLEVENFALRRAAEITLDQNATWFRVVTKTSDIIGGTQNRGTSVGVSGGSGSRGGGVGVGIGFDLTPDRKAYQSRLEIITGSGPKPDGAEGRIYDAQSVIDTSSTNSTVSN